MPADSLPRIEALRVENYRALQNLQLEKLTPLTVLLGANGSGKSTLFDVFAFLAECLEGGLRNAWERRGGFRGLHSRGAAGPVLIALKYRERPGEPLMTYHLELEEEDNRPRVKREFLRWSRQAKSNPKAAPFQFFTYRDGKGEIASGETAAGKKDRKQRDLASAGELALHLLGGFAEYPRVNALRTFVSDWHLSCLSVDAARESPVAGAQERLSKSGDNLPNVIQHLREREPERLEQIFETLRERVPRLEKVVTSVTPAGRLQLAIKDAPFAEPVLSRFASDGTLKMLACLTLLYSPAGPRLIGIEEPENFLHPHLLQELAEECALATEHSQLLVTTHSPFFIDALHPDQVWMLARGRDGYTRATRVSSMPGIAELMNQGATLGDLWMKQYFSKNEFPAQED